MRLLSPCIFFASKSNTQFLHNKPSAHCVSKPHATTSSSTDTCDQGTVFQADTASLLQLLSSSLSNLQRTVWDYLLEINCPARWLVIFFIYQQTCA